MQKILYRQYAIILFLLHSVHLYLCTVNDRHTQGGDIGYTAPFIAK